MCKFVFVVTLIVTYAFVVRIVLKERVMWRAAQRFKEWYYTNPGVYVGISPEGLRLLFEFIDAYDAHERVNPFWRFDWIRAEWLSLLDDLPPNTPMSSPYGAPKSGCLSF